MHPQWVPQLADAADLIDLLADDPGVGGWRDLPVLVPNERGLDRALERGMRHVAIFGWPPRRSRSATCTAPWTPS